MYETNKIVITTVILLSVMFLTLAEDKRIITTLKYSKYRVKPTIVNGRPATEEKFPYLVSIKSEIKPQLWKSHCGGSIIKPVRVLTAAHCFEAQNFHYLHNPDKLRIVGGSLFNILRHADNSSDNRSEQWRKIQSVVLHRYFNFPLNDIALVTLKSPFNYNSVVNYVVPARRMIDYVGPCYVAGFGRTSDVGDFPSTELLFGEVAVMSRIKCRFIWEINMDPFICSQSVFADVAIGDSGGPLVCSGTGAENYRELVGIVCGKNYDKTTLYTRVSTHRYWIDGNSTKFHGINIVIVLAAMSKYILFGLHVSLCYLIKIIKDGLHRTIFNHQNLAMNLPRLITGYYVVIGRQIGLSTITQIRSVGIWFPAVDINCLACLD